ncbi:MAG: TetR/AcrR family transcriptional regulator [Cellvibrionaceae bacterium]|nr:TetR/AcrR family transcriptional regulator [Cellvibrionaceae bacterium]MCV6625503.1 TetR/AcrR family transcriptional regulator [Cellvibrionaceae bacterium]
MSANPQIPRELLEKNKPQQQRAIQTYERILSASAELLDEIGVERISTNLIAERAEITVPALYRYFANKYAVLYTLGARLMDRQNEVLADWHQSYFKPHQLGELFDNLDQLVRTTYEVTAAQQGGLSILSAMRAVPILQEVRLLSHQQMTDWMMEQWARHFEIVEPERLALQSRLSMEVVTAAVEMALEDPQMPADLAIEEASKIMVLYWRDLISNLPPKK